MRTRALARAWRSVSALVLVSTMRLAPCSSKWLRVLMKGHYTWAIPATHTDGGVHVPADADLQDAKEAMLKHHVAGRDVRDPRVLAAMRKVPREAFVPAFLHEAAYDDRPHQIGYDQTISQPYVVALMTAALQLQGGEKVLEVGTGSG